MSIQSPIPFARYHWVQQQKASKRPSRPINRQISLDHNSKPKRVTAWYSGGCLGNVWAHVAAAGPVRVSESQAQRLGKQLEVASSCCWLISQPAAAMAVRQSWQAEMFCFPREQSVAISFGRAMSLTAQYPACFVPCNRANQSGQ